MAKQIIIDDPKDNSVGFMSNASYYGFRLNDKWYITMEHYITSQKFTGTTFEDTLLNTPTIPKLRMLSQGRVATIRKGNGMRKKILYGDLDCTIRSDWDDKMPEIYLEGLVAKFEQNKHLIPRLVSTGNARLVVVSDPITGQILEMLRSRYKNKKVNVTPLSYHTDIPNNLHDTEEALLRKLFTLTNIIRLLECSAKIYVDMVKDTLYNVLPGNKKENEAIIGTITTWCKNTTYSNIYKSMPRCKSTMEFIETLYSEHFLKHIDYDVVLFLVGVMIFIKSNDANLFEVMNDKVSHLISNTSNIKLRPGVRSYRMSPDISPKELTLDVDTKEHTFQRESGTGHLYIIHNDTTFEVHGSKVRKHKLKLISMGGEYIKSEPRGYVRFSNQSLSVVNDYILNTAPKSQRYFMMYKSKLSESLALYLKGCVSMLSIMDEVIITDSIMRFVIKSYNLGATLKRYKKKRIKKGDITNIVNELLETSLASFEKEYGMNKKAKKYLTKQLYRACPDLHTISNNVDTVDSDSFADVVWRSILGVKKNIENTFLNETEEGGIQLPPKKYVDIYMWLHPEPKRVSAQQYVKERLSMEKSKNKKEGNDNFTIDYERIIRSHISMKDQESLKEFSNELSKFTSSVQMGNDTALEEEAGADPEGTNSEEAVENAEITDQLLDYPFDTLEGPAEGEPTEGETVPEEPANEPSLIDLSPIVSPREEALGEIKYMKGNMLNSKDSVWVAAIVNGVSGVCPNKTPTEKVANMIYSTYPYANTYSDSRRELGSVMLSFPYLPKENLPESLQLSSTSIIAESTPEHKYIASLVCEMLPGGPKGGTEPGTDNLQDRLGWFEECLNNLRGRKDITTLSFAKACLSTDHMKVLERFITQTRITIYIFQGNTRGKKESNEVIKDVNHTILTGNEPVGDDELVRDEPVGDDDEFGDDEN